MPRVLSSHRLLPALLLLITAAQGQDEDPGILRRTGLIAQYESGNRAVRQIDADIAFRWDEPPVPGLQAGPFTSHWHGHLRVDEPGRYVISAWVRGTVSVSVDGQPTLEGEADRDRWLRGKPVDLTFGDRRIEVRYHGNSPGGTLRLFWSSADFSLEPIPAHLFSHSKPTTPLVAQSDISDHFDALRCARCHQSADTAAPGPSLRRISTLATDSIVAKLAAPPKPNDNMPRFNFSKDEARAVAAFLLSRSEPPKPGTAPRGKSGDHAAGRKLVTTLGCLACHTLDDVGTTSRFSGGELADVAVRRDAPWVFAWLKDPAGLNADHRMPLFRLTTDERRQIALFLGGDRKEKPPTFSAQQIHAGGELVRAARCANCHRIRDADPAPPIGRIRSSHNREGCLSAARESGHPTYPQLSSRERRQLHSFGRMKITRAQRGYQHGRRLLRQRNCLSCHARDSQTGLANVVAGLLPRDPSLKAIAPSLLPPSLTAVGDKLRDEALADAVTGAQKSARLPWLAVRMPGFRHTPPERAAMMRYLIEHDRIPDSANPVATRPSVSTQTLIQGHTLVGPQGFSCIACHSAGSYQPRNVGAGTRGSDLLLMNHRIRPAFFKRWTRSPSRIEPGTEMPSIMRPVDGILDNDLGRQLDAVRQALGDPNFRIPTNPGSYEQIVSAGPNEEPRVIRDVFVDPDDDSSFVARPLVIGFSNGHNVMFDLDAFGLRHWWLGETARQKTEGKSWYWETAGIGVATQSAGADIRLGLANGKILAPTMREASNGRLKTWKQDGNTVSFSYRLRFEGEGLRHSMEITERIAPARQETQSGFRRTVVIANPPADFEVLLRLPQSAPEISIKPAGSVRSDEGRWLPLSDGRVSVLYLTGLRRPRLRQQHRRVFRSGAEPITTVPGYDGMRLPIDRSIMPTALARGTDGRLGMTSLKGHVLWLTDEDGDGVEESLLMFEEGLAAPFGLLADDDGLLVAHKPEVIRLRDTDGDGRSDHREVVATGWGYSDDYHDWTCGLVRDSQGNLYVGLGSDYSQPRREKSRSRWRGTVLRIAPDGHTAPISWSFRYPIGFAIDQHDRVFVTDNQGVQNTFNEINHVQPGRHYGVPSRHETKQDVDETTPAIRIPHPWTRSVNGLAFVPPGDSPFSGQAIAGDYDSHQLIRLSFQTVGTTTQGAVYPLSRPARRSGGSDFVGPICLHVDADGTIYVGSIHDSGWLGGRNTGALERLRPNGRPGNGIREIRAVTDGFEIEFLKPVAASTALNPANYTISGFTRRWQGSYSTPDSDRHTLRLRSVRRTSPTTFLLASTTPFREEHVYEINVTKVVEGLFPETAYYTMKQVPR